MEWVRHYHGDDALRSLIASLPVTVRTELGSMPVTSWCSFHSLIVLDRAIQERFGRGRDLMRELGRYGAHYDLSTTHRLLRRGDLSEFLRRSAALRWQAQDFGTVQCHQLSASSCEMRHIGARCFSPLYCAGAAGYYEQVVTMFGGSSVTVEEPACRSRGDEECLFRLRWL